MKKLLVCLLAIAIVFACACVSFAAESPITIVSPSNVSIGGDSLLVSVKVTEPMEIRVSVDLVVEGEPEAVREPVVKESTQKLWYYTEQLQPLEPGLYCITVEKKNENDNFVAEAAAYVMLEKKTDEILDVAIEKAESKEGNALQKFLQLLKNLFTAK